MRVVVKYEESCISSFQDDGEWAPWSAEYSFSVESVEVVDEDYNTSYNEEGFLVADTDTNVFVLSMRYGSGDSFGHASGHGAILGCWSNYDKAKAAFEKVEKQIAEYTIEVQDDFDRWIKILNPGTDYFGGCESVDLDSFSVATPKLSFKP